MSEAERAAKRLYYRKNRARILAQQAVYQAHRRRDGRVRAQRSADTKRWRARFKAEMRREGEPGRGGKGLSPEGYRYRLQAGAPVPAWPWPVEPAKGRHVGPARVGDVGQF